MRVRHGVFGVGVITEVLRPEQVPQVAPSDTFGGEARPFAGPPTALVGCRLSVLWGGGSTTASDYRPVQIPQSPFLLRSD